MQLRRPNRSLPVFVAILALLLGAPSPSAEAATESTSSISGMISDVDGRAFVAPERAGIDLIDADTGIRAGGFEVTSGDGRYRVDGLAPGRYRIGLWHDGPTGEFVHWYGGAYEPADAAIVTLAAGENREVDLNVERGAVITGTFTGDGERLREFNQVTLTPVGDTPKPPPSVVMVLTGKDGTFRTFPLPPGLYELTFGNTERWRPENQNGSHPEDAEQGPPLALGVEEHRLLDVRFERTTSIEGTVLVRTAAGEVPFDGIVELEQLDGPHSRSERPGTDGRWSADGLDPGTYRVSFTSWDGSTPTVLEYWSNATTERASKPIVVAPWQVVSGVDAVIEPAAVVSGRLLRSGATSTSAPEPLGGAVDVLRRDPASGKYAVYGDPVAPFSTDGRFRLALPPGRYSLYFRSEWPGDQLGGEYWKASRTFAGRTDLTVVAGGTTKLGDVVLDARMFEVNRLAGADRFATAVQVSRRMYGTGVRAPVVYIANGMDYPDALAAGPAAIASGGVVLPVTRDVIPAAVAAELTRIRPKRIVIAGGTGVVGSTIAAQLRRYVDTASAVVRLGGSTRYDTGRSLVRDAFDQSDVAFLATGRNYPDALSAGPAAGYLGAPVILVDGQSTRLDASTTALLRELGVTDVRLVGGTAAISRSLEASVKVLGLKTTRYAGADRYEVGGAMNKAVFPRGDHAFVASGQGFPDALAGGPLAGARHEPILLVQRNCVPFATESAFYTRAVAKTTLLGGVGVLATGVGARHELC